MKIIFFGTANEALPILETLSRHYEIAAVVTQPDAKAGRSQELVETPVSVLATEMNAKIFKPISIKDDQSVMDELKKIGADLFVIVAYGQILPANIINLPKYKTINVHFSLLPKYRGASPIQSALLNGETETGISIFALDEKMDHGPLLAQQKCAIDDNDNAVSLSQKLAFQSARMIPEVIEGYISGKIRAIKQDDARASFSTEISKAHGKIDWQKSAEEIYNQFRAYYPWPGIWTFWNGKILKIIDCVPTNMQKNESTNDYKCGEVLEGGVVACGKSSFLQIKTLQLEGKNETGIKDFLNGYREFVGSILE